MWFGELLGDSQECQKFFLITQILHYLGRNLLPLAKAAFLTRKWAALSLMKFDQQLINSSCLIQIDEFSQKLDPKNPPFLLREY